MSGKEEMRRALNMICERVEQRLPPGFSIELTMDCEEASISLFDDEGNELEFCSDDNNGIDAACDEAQQIAAASIFGADVEPKRIVLTPEQASSMLSDEDYIHTFIQSPNGALIGADWMRSVLIEAIKSNRCEIGGDGCKAMNHGLVVMMSPPLFVECKEGFDYKAFESGLLAASE